MNIEDKRFTGRESSSIDPEDDIEILYQARLEALRTGFLRKFEQKLGAVMREATAQLKTDLTKYRDGIEASISSPLVKNKTGVEKKEVARTARESFADKFKVIEQKAESKLF